MTSGAVVHNRVCRKPMAKTLSDMVKVNVFYGEDICAKIKTSV